MSNNEQAEYYWVAHSTDYKDFSKWMPTAEEARADFFSRFSYRRKCTIHAGMPYKEGIFTKYENIYDENTVHDVTRNTQLRSGK